MMRRLLVAAVAAALASGYALTLGSAQTGSGTVPDRKQLAQRILDSPESHFLSSSARLSVEMAARGDQQMNHASQPDGATARAAAGAAVAQGGEGPGSTSFTNVRVNNPGEDTHQQDQTTQSETTIAAVGNKVAVGFNDSQTTLLALTAGTALNGFAYSTDGGATFTDGGALPNRNGCNGFGDPWLTTDRAGVMYYGSLVQCLSLTRSALDVGVAKSTDGGRTWSQPVIVSSNLGADLGFYLGDKDAFTVGRDPNTASKDVIYGAWDDSVFDPITLSQLNGLPVAHSNDGGATWTVVYAGQIAVGPCPSGPGFLFGQYIGANPFVDPSTGTLYVTAEKLATDCSSPGKGGPLVRTIVMFTSTDGGNTFGPETTVAVVGQAGPPFDEFNLGDGKYMRSIEFPSPGIRGGTLYIAWNDGSAVGGHSHVRLATSTNGGATWSSSWVTSGSNDEIQPALSADASGVHIVYYRRNPDNTLDVYVSNSGGGGFSAARVTTQSFPGVLNYPQFDPIIAPTYMGDYIANVSAGGRELFAWGDNRDIVRNFLYPSGRNDPDVFFAAQRGAGDQQQG
jgi:hypothetical protein